MMEAHGNYKTQRPHTAATARSGGARSSASSSPRNHALTADTTRPLGAPSSPPRPFGFGYTEERIRPSTATTKNGKKARPFSRSQDRDCDGKDRASGGEVRSILASEARNSWAFNVPPVPRSPRCFGAPSALEKRYGGGLVGQPRGAGCDDTSVGATHRTRQSPTRRSQSIANRTSPRILPFDDGIAWRVQANTNVSVRHPPRKEIVTVERLFGEDNVRPCTIEKKQKRDIESAPHTSTIDEKGGSYARCESIRSDELKEGGEERVVDDREAERIFAAIEARQRLKRRQYEDAVKKGMLLRSEEDDGIAITTPAGNAGDLFLLSQYPHLPIARPDSSKLGHPRRLSVLCEGKGTNRKGQRRRERRDFTDQIDQRLTETSTITTTQIATSLGGDGNSESKNLLSPAFKLERDESPAGMEEGREGVANQQQLGYEDGGRKRSLEGGPALEEPPFTIPTQHSLREVTVAKCGENVKQCRSGHEEQRQGNETSVILEDEISLPTTQVAEDPDLGEGTPLNAAIFAASPSSLLHQHDEGEDKGVAIPRRHYPSVPLQRPSSAFGMVYRPWSRLQLEAEAEKAFLGLEERPASPPSRNKSGCVNSASSRCTLFKNEKKMKHISGVENSSSCPPTLAASLGVKKKKISFPIDFTRPHPRRSKHGCVMVDDEDEAIFGIAEGPAVTKGKTHTHESEDEERARWNRTLSVSGSAEERGQGRDAVGNRGPQRGGRRGRQRGSLSSSLNNSPTNLTLADLQQEALPFSVSPTQRRGKIVMLDEGVGGLLLDEEMAAVIPFSLEMKEGRQSGRRASALLVKGNAAAAAGDFTTANSHVTLGASGGGLLRVSDYVLYNRRTDKASGAVRAVWLTSATTTTAAIAAIAAQEEGESFSSPAPLTGASTDAAVDDRNARNGNATIDHDASRPSALKIEKYSAPVCAPNTGTSRSSVPPCGGRGGGDLVVTAAPKNGISSDEDKRSVAVVRGVDVAAMSLTSNNKSNTNTNDAAMRMGRSLEYFGLYQKHLEEIIRSSAAQENESSGSGGRAVVLGSGHHVPRPPRLPSYPNPNPTNLGQLAIASETLAKCKGLSPSVIPNSDDHKISYRLAKAPLEESDEETSATCGEKDISFAPSAVSSVASIGAAFYKRPDGSPRSIFDHSGGPLRKPRTFFSSSPALQ